MIIGRPCAFQNGVAVGIAHDHRRVVLGVRKGVDGIDPHTHCGNSRLACHPIADDRAIAAVIRHSAAAAVMLVPPCAALLRLGHRLRSLRDLVLRAGAKRAGVTHTGLDLDDLADSAVIHHALDRLQAGIPGDWPVDHIECAVFLHNAVHLHGIRHRGRHGLFNAHADAALGAFLGDLNMVAVFGVHNAQVRLHLIQHLLPVVKFGDVVVLAAVVDIPFPGIDGAGLHLRQAECVASLESGRYADREDEEDFGRDPDGPFRTGGRAAGRAAVPAQQRGRVVRDRRGHSGGRRLLGVQRCLTWRISIKSPRMAAFRMRS